MSTFRRVKAALIGSGAISGTYLNNLTRNFHVVDLVGCSDLIDERAEKRAEEFGIKKMTNEEILNDPTIEIVVNTTYPKAHYEVTKAALEAGKNVYTEKMLAVTLEEGKELMELARSKGLLFTTAPDTFLGGGWQTARKAIDDGLIGEPLLVDAACIRTYQDYGDKYAEPKGFVFGEGGGIPFDMGGYYLHNMINMFGSIKRVSGFMRTYNPQRPYLNPRHPRYGQEFTIDSPNTMVSSLEFANGVMGNLTITSEAGTYGEPYFAVHGTQGILKLFDPNDFGGKLILTRNIDGVSVELPTLYPYNIDSRGIGVADMAYALLNGRIPRDDAAIGYHAFEAIHGIWKSSVEGIVYNMESVCERPKLFPLVQAGGQAFEQQLND